MDDPVFDGWNNFHFMVGSAAAGLIGLLFVGVSLAAGLNVDRSKTIRAVDIYMTPTALHFAIVLATSAVALAPRLPAPAKAAVFGSSALVGFAYEMFACIEMRRRTSDMQPPHWSDFWLYGAVPAALYLGFAAASATLWARAAWAVHATAAFMLALLLIGIRNAWDLVTWMAPRQKTGTD